MCFPAVNLGTGLDPRGFVRKPLRPCWRPFHYALGPCHPVARRGIHRLTAKLTAGSLCPTVQGAEAAFR